MQTPADPRFRKRVPCRLSVGGSAYSGMVLNLSRGGLFVQTSAGVRPGDAVDVQLNVPSHPASIAVAGRVVWKRIVHAQLRSLTQGGVGLRIQNAPESYYRFLLGVSGSDGRPAGPRAEPAPERTPAAEVRFRVRVQQQGGPRSRVLCLSGTDEQVARRRALAEVGDGWVVLELERL